MLNAFTYAQHKVYAVTPDQLVFKIESSNKPSIVQFWVPNCENNIEIVEGYKNLMENYGNAINFYFIGITNKEELVEELMAKTNYQFDFYIIDKSVSPENLYLRKETFNRTFTEIISAKKKDFVTGYFGRKNVSFFLTRSIKIRKSKIRQLIQN
jgi:thiol-disulfide isomerase/thioredoxin